MLDYTKWEWTGIRHRDKQSFFYKRFNFWLFIEIKSGCFHCEEYMHLILYTYMCALCSFLYECIYTHKNIFHHIYRVINSLSLHKYKMCKFIQKEAKQIFKFYYYSFITTIKYKYTVFPDVPKAFWLFRVANHWKAKLELCSEREHTKFFLSTTLYSKHFYNDLLIDLYL